MKVFGFVRQRSAAKFIMADLVHAFRRLGWDYAWFDMEVWREDVLKTPIEKRRQAIDNLISDMINFQPDIIISYGLEAFYPLFSDIIDKEERPFFSYFQELPFLCFFFDFGSPFTDPGPVNAIPFIRQMQGQQFLFLCWDKDALDVIHEKGITKCIYFPMGVNEETFKAIRLNEADRKKYSCDFCFVGGPTPRRMQMLEVIRDKDLKIYGYEEIKWQSSPHLKPYYQYPVFSQDELVKIYNASIASINITREHGKSSLNMRVYEAMACGSLLLTDDKEDARELFCPDREILIYEDEKDFRKKVDWITQNSNRVREMANRGREQILEEHTYYRRIQTLVPVIERFILEFRAVKDISEKINKGQFSDALESIDSLINSGRGSLNAEVLYFIKHEILMAIGQIWSAERALFNSLKANPLFISAQKSKMRFEMR